MQAPFWHLRSPRQPRGLFPAPKTAPSNSGTPIPRPWLEACGARSVRYVTWASTFGWTALQQRRAGCIERVSEAQLLDVIEINELNTDDPGSAATTEPGDALHRTFGIPPCGQRMLAEGVRENQRCACFRLAVQLKCAGLPHDAALTVMEAWSRKNRPGDGKRIITADEVRTQVADAYRKPYRSAGSEDPSVTPFCHPACKVKRKAPDSDQKSSEARRHNLEIQ